MTEMSEPNETAAGLMPVSTPRSVSRAGLAVISIALLAGTSISGYLTLSALSGTPVRGCGTSAEAADCHEVLSSRWSTWLGMPVAVPAVSLFATGLVVSVFMWPFVPPHPRTLACRLNTCLISLLAAAAVWFVGLQAMIVGKWCVLCMGVHACSLVAFVCWSLPV